MNRSPRPPRKKSLLSPSSWEDLPGWNEEAPDRTRRCKVCEADIGHLRANALYCSDECRPKKKAAPENVEAKCEGCGVSISHMRAGTRFCIAKCRYLFVTYGIGRLEFEKLYDAQKGKCAICKRHQNYQSLAVDHSHANGTVRGLLCKRCNHELLGAAFDSAVILQAAADYLNTPPAYALIGKKKPKR